MSRSRSDNGGFSVTSGNWSCSSGMIRAFTMRSSVSLICSMITVELAKLFGRLIRALGSVDRVIVGISVAPGCWHLSIIPQDGIVGKWEFPTFPPAHLDSPVFPGTFRPVGGNQISYQTTLQSGILQKAGQVAKTHPAFSTLSTT